MVVSGLPGEESTQQIEQPIPDMTMTYNRTPLGKISDFKMSGAAAGFLGDQFGSMGNDTPDQMPSFPTTTCRSG